MKLKGRLVLEGETGPETVELDTSPFIIGRVGELRLPDARVSRRHARITKDDKGFLVEDLESSNGTFVNGKRISKPCQIKTGDVIRVGPFRIAVVLEQPDDESESTKTAKKVRAKRRPSSRPTEQMVPIARKGPTNRVRPTIGTKPREQSAADITQSDSRAETAILSVRSGTEVWQLPVGQRFDLEETLAFGDLNVGGPAGAIVYRDDGYWFEPEVARERLHLNGKQVTEPTRLESGDALHLGPIELELKLLK